MYDILRSENIRGVLLDFISGYPIDVRISLSKKEPVYSVNNKVLDENTLKLLLENRIIDYAGNESFLACPKDASIKLNVILICPVHKVALQKIEIYENKITGAIINAPAGEMSQNLIKRGYFLKCEKGETVFNPDFLYRCENGHVFGLEDAIVANVKKYKVNEDTLKFIKEYFNKLNQASNFLSSGGYQIIENRKFKGLSGVDYEFDLMAKKGEQQFAFYFIKGDKVEELLSLLPKLYDISQLGNVPLNIFIVTGKQINDDLLHMFDRYNVKVIKAEKTDEIIDFITKNLKS
ncbi:MAG: hypothetical protein ACP5LX_01455 [Nitrososphaeria archaeon]